MPKTSKVKKKASKSKTANKPKSAATVSKTKETNKGPIKISKTYIPKESEKYMCPKHLAFFKKKLQDWKTDLKRTSNEAIYNSSLDDNSTSADIVDQASSYTEKNVELRAINRQIKLISKIDSALKRIQDGSYGFCEDTGEPIGLKRLIARPVATLCIAAQEKHEKEEKVFADD